MVKVKQTVKCLKCAGAGEIGHYRHYADGVCFECKGAGVVTLKPERKAPVTLRTIDRRYVAARVGFVYDGANGVIEAMPGTDLALVAFRGDDYSPVLFTVELNVFDLAAGRAVYDRNSLNNGAIAARAQLPAVALAAAPMVAELVRRQARIDAVLAATVAPEGDAELRALSDART